MRVAVTVDGQEDVTWADWLALAGATERLGFDGLFRSDHYLSIEGRLERGSLEAWGTICALAAVTERIRLGALVSPATLRHPSLLARLVVTADHVSGGRAELGLGAGWLEPEHVALGFPFPPLPERWDAFAEQVEIISRSWAADGPFDFEGRHFTLRDADPSPKPVRSPAPLILGGLAKRRSLALAARWATEYNLVWVTPEEVGPLRVRIAAACEEHGRDPATLPVSNVVYFMLGEDEADLGHRAEALSAWRGAPVDLEGLRARHLVGTPEEVRARLAAHAEAGIERVYLQLLLHRDLDQLELYAAAGLTPASS